MFARSRRNLANLFALSMGSILIVFAGVGYYFVAKAQLESFDDDLYRRSKNLASQVQNQLRHNIWGMESDNDLFKVGYAIASLPSDFTYVRWYNDRKKLIYSHNDASASESLSLTPTYRTIVINGNLQKNNGEKVWVREATLPVLKDNSPVGFLQVGLPMTRVRDNLNQFRLFLTLGVPVTFGIIGVTGWFLGGLAMQPTRRAYDRLQRFTADASHELRAPVAAVLSNAQVALMPPFDEEELRFRLENIVEVAKSMSTLIGNLLFLSRHQGQLEPSALKNINLGEFLRSLFDEFQPQSTSQHLNFTIQLPAQPVNIKAEPDLLKQVFANLLTNAFKYTSAGGTVQIKLSTQSHRAIIQIEDSGIGIPEEDLPHVFERFYRVDTARSRDSGGFGLGLAIAQQIIQAHQGEIMVKSQLGVGSIFRVELPWGGVGR